MACMPDCANKRQHCADSDLPPGLPSSATRRPLRACTSTRNRVQIQMKYLGTATVPLPFHPTFLGGSVRAGEQICLRERGECDGHAPGVTKSLA